MSKQDFPQELVAYSPEEVAEMTGASVSWIKAQATSGNVPHVTFGKGKIAFRAAHITALLDACEKRGNEKPSDELPGSLVANSDAKFQIEFDNAKRAGFSDSRARAHAASA